MTYDNNSGYPTRRRAKQAPIDRTSAGFSPVNKAAASVAERRRMAAWLLKKQSDEECLKHVKITPTKPPNIL